MKKRAIFIGLLAGLLLVPSIGFSQDYQIGVLANRGAMQVLKEWKATADYLSAKSGKTFSVVPLTYDQLPQWTKEKKIDFILTNSAMYAEFNKLYGVQAIATQVGQYKNQPLDQFGSLILVRHDSPIEKLSDLRGKAFGCASRSAFGGWLMSVRLLTENGIDSDSNFKFVRELKTHDNVIYAVLNGAIDAGSVRTGSLEKMIQEGKVKASDFKIIHQINDDFPLLHSTQLYPEYPMAACQHVSPEIRNLVSRSLIALRASDAAATDARITGWKEPMEYKQVVECLVVIKYGAFKDQAPVFSMNTAGEKGENPSTPAPAEAVQHSKAPGRTPKARVSAQ